MVKRHIKTPLELIEFFEKPNSSRQKQYEAIRALVVEKLSVEEVSKKFGYKPSTIYSMLRDVKANKLDCDEIVQNMDKGLFYASTGVDLKDIVISSNKIEIQIKQRGNAKYKTEFIGDGGKVLATSIKNPAVFELDQKATFVRANVYSSNDFTAWIQPVFVKQ